MKFLHVADLHLGYRQYGLAERLHDFDEVFLYIVEKAIEHKVDFVLLAGDLFDKRTIEPSVLGVALRGLQRLHDYDIPVLAVEGNHERAYYREQMSWMQFLDSQHYLRLLNPHFENGRAVLSSRESYVDLPGDVRVYGINYYGASTDDVFAQVSDDLRKNSGESNESSRFTILMAHAGLEGQVPQASGMVSQATLDLFAERVDYIALGHIHKPYIVDGWIHNPGSPETCNIEETEWLERGYFLVELTPDGISSYQTELIAPPRRPFYRLRLEVDSLISPDYVYDAVAELVRNENVVCDPRPVVELVLIGILPFNRADLDLGTIKASLDDAWSPLMSSVRNLSTSADFQIDVDTEASRPELERSIIRRLLEQDARFQPNAEAWASVAIEIKSLSLQKAPDSAIVNVLRHAMKEE